ncbi:MAG: chemotaxis protein CheX [Campylobacterota bacterium]|nr:chemotaxis protein CheX [Campylobacterota bacterium]
MIHYIETAAQNFSSHQLQASFEKINQLPKVRTFIAYIDVAMLSGESKRVYLACDEALLKEIAKLFLGEDITDEETLKDFALETANMVIGSAKVIAEEENVVPFSIGTPIFEKFDYFDLPSDDQSILSINEHTVIIATKEL